MPEKDNQRRPFESIRRWRDRILNRNKYGTYGGELKSSVITSDRPDQKPTGNWFQRIRKFRHPYGTYGDLMHTFTQEERQLASDSNNKIALRDADFAYDVYNRIQNFQDYPTRRANYDRRTDEYRGNYASSLLPFKKDSNSNDFLSQIWRWYSRKRGYNSRMNAQNASFTNMGTDIIDLDKNVIRLTPRSRQSTALFNEFVEEKLPSVHNASEYQQGRVSMFGDIHKVPIENISLYAGVENGHFKLDSLQNFNPNTTIYPARNIKRNVQPITKLVIKNIENPTEYEQNNSKRFFYNNLNSNIDWYWYRRPNTETSPEFEEERKQAKEQHAAKIDSLLRLGKTMEATNEMYPDYNNNRPYSYRFLRDMNDWQRETDWPHDSYEPKWLQNNIDSLRTLGWNLRSRLYGDKESTGYFYVDTTGQEHPISDYNASILDSKMVFGNPTGGKFIGRIQDISLPQLDSLNNWLSKNPSWLIRPDLGSFSQYRLDNPSLKLYLKQYFEHPRPEDPNVFTVGTTEPNKAFE